MKWNIYAQIVFWETRRRERIKPIEDFISKLLAKEDDWGGAKQW